MNSPRYLIVLLGFLIGLSPLAIDMYLPSLPAITDSLSTSPEAVQTSLTVFLFFFGVPQLFFGPLSDAFGRRFSIFCGLALYLVGSAICALAPNIETLWVARAMQGAGSAAISVTVPALVKDKFEGPDYTRTVGFIMMVMAVAPLAAPILGGIIFNLGGWRSIFYSLVAVSAVCALLFYLSVSESLVHEKRQPLNFSGLIKNYRILFSDRLCLSLSLIVGSMMAGMMAFITGSPFVYIELYGVSPEHYGFLFGINVLGMMALTYLNNHLIKNLTNRKLLFGNLIVVVVASLFLLMLSYWSKPPLVILVIAFAIFIANLGTITANIQVILLSRFPHMAGATSAMLGSIRFGVGSLGGVAVSVFHQPSSAPLTGVIGVCGLLAMTAYFVSRVWQNGIEASTQSRH